jgi:riboflavin kinase / FMN adenylyltransferase
MALDKSQVIPELPSGVKTAVTVGTFDGVHEGHLAILEQLHQAADSRGLRSMVITFDPHPRHVLQPDSDIRLLTATRAKLRLLAETGIDYTAVLAFSREFSQVSAERFVIDYLIGRFNMNCLVMGYDHAFGKDRAGGEGVLAELSKVYAFDLIKVPPVIRQDAPVSSTRIRRALAQGDMQQAAGLLGRLYTIGGTVVTGAGRGRKLGHPTANIRSSERGREVIPHGIYAAAVDLDGVMMPGALHYGPRPTFDEQDSTMELNLFDYQGDLYGRELEVAVVEKIRPILSFSGAEELTQQMDEDDKTIKSAFERLGPGFNSTG